MDLFTPVIPSLKQHPIFQMLLQDRLAPERRELSSWADGFRDRDGKFVQEFQSTFESGLWELYLHASTKVWGFQLDQGSASPDFVVTAPVPLCIEATIAAPASGGKPAFGYDSSDIPDDFSQFNAEASIRICNSFTSKVRRYRDYYAALPHVTNRPFIVAIAAFDRPLAHFAAGRSVIAAMYGLYHDEAATPPDADSVVSYNVSAAAKSETVDVPLGLFCGPTYPEVSAVIYSSLATWGKVRALADNPAAKTIYQTFHPKEGDLRPEVRNTLKENYNEHLLDGLLVLHNPFAHSPIPEGVLSHSRLAEIHVASDGELVTKAPDDFLLLRTLWSVHERGDGESAV
jgi:hypothetical protein